MNTKRPDSVPFNRPMIQADLVWLEQNPVVKEMRELVEQYARKGLPVMNGSLRYSNFTEGPEHLFTLNPYRQWEYASLLARLPEMGTSIRFLDVGGAGSLLPYVLAQKRHQGTATDTSPFLVAACREVAEKESLPLEAIVCDATRDLRNAGREFDLVTMISVLEHIPEAQWPALWENLADSLRHGGWLYLTFDYGDYETRQPFGRSIHEIGPVLAGLKGAGLIPVGNDPASLEAEWLSRRSAPDAEKIGRRHLLNMGNVDGATRWTSLMKHVMKRATVKCLRADMRYSKHNYFRLLLEKK